MVTNNSKNKVSIIIPTMWKSDKIFKMLPIYEKSEYVKEVIIIDNAPNLKPNLDSYSKVIYYTDGENIYVNPAWNLGYTLSNYEVILANDDIVINEFDEVISLLLSSEFDIVGVSLDKPNGALRIDNIDKFPANSYGCFMYLKKYIYIPEKFKIWYGDQFLFEVNEKRGILKNVNLETNVSETLNSNKQELRKNVALKDVQIYQKEGFPKNVNKTKPKVLAVLVNYGDEQLNYLEEVVNELKSFKKYEVTVIVNSNIPLEIPNIDKVNLYDNMEDYQLLPLTCRSVIIDNIENFDIFIYGENDHLFKEIHVDSHIYYSKILPKNRIPGLIQYEENESGKFYPAYHAHYEWDFSSVETYDDKKFAHFTNVHQATFILTKEQLITISEKHNFKEFFGTSRYSFKCKVNTDIYDFCGMKKMICITEFKNNLIHHLPNLYINGDNGRNKNQRSDNGRMNNSLIKLLSKSEPKIICGIATTMERKESFKESVNSIVNQVDKLIVYQNDYYEMFDFLKSDKIEVISGIQTGVDMGDAGKFYNVGNYPDSYYLSIDDDIIYPKDYVSSVIEDLKLLDNKVVVSHHGRVLKERVFNYYTDYIKSYHFKKPHIGYDIIDIPGTGVMAFHTKYVPISFLDFIHPNMADIIVGVKMSKLKISCICLPHKENWLRDSNKYDESSSLFYSNKSNEILNKYLSDNFVAREKTEVVNKNILDIILNKKVKINDDLIVTVRPQDELKINNPISLPEPIDENKKSTENIKERLFKFLTKKVETKKTVENKEEINKKRMILNDENKLPIIKTIKQKPKSPNTVLDNKGGRFNF
jgi:hypothetical protein